MAFLDKKNIDDSIIRANIVGLVNNLSNNIKFFNVWKNDELQEIRVPFFYAISGDEKILQDYFVTWSDCAPNFVEGNVDWIPRGMISLQGFSVRPEELTSRYVRGFYTKETNGELRRYNSYINSIPFQLDFQAEILSDTMIDIFKIIQSITEFLYRTQVFSVNFRGFRVPSQVGFPDNEGIEKQFEFTYGLTDRLKTTFSIELHSFLPVVDNTQEMAASQTISGFRSSFFVDNDNKDESTMTSDTSTTPSSSYAPDVIPNSDGSFDPTLIKDLPIGGTTDKFSGNYYE